MLLANDIGNGIEVLVKADVNQRLAGVGRNDTFYTAVKSVVKIMGIACFVGRRHKASAAVFIAAFKQATEIVEQYRRDLSEWERKVKSNQAPDRHSPPPEKQSVRNRLKQLQAESKQRRTHNRYSQDRER